MPFVICSVFQNSLTTENVLIEDTGRPQSQDHPSLNLHFLLTHINGSLW